MAFDGIVIANIVSDMQNLLMGGRIYKIYQPEPDELLLIIKNNKETCRLLLSASPGLPLVYFTESNKTNPMTAPNFCMLLRKHITNGRIIGISQPGMDRIIELTIEHLNELGDVCRKRLIVELMGKHSNIIFVDGDGSVNDGSSESLSEDNIYKEDDFSKDGIIIDSIKHISHQVSSVREVLPGRSYEAPPDQGKICLHDLTPLLMEEKVLSKATTVQKAIYTSIRGISPVAAAEIAFRAGIDAGAAVSSLTEEEQGLLYGELNRLSEEIKGHRFAPNIIYQNGIPEDFSSFYMTMFDPSGNVTISDSVGNMTISDSVGNMTISDSVGKTFTSGPSDNASVNTATSGSYGIERFETISQVLETFYAQKEIIARIRQKSADLRRIVQNATERSAKKYDLQRKQLKDTEKRDKYRIYGELLHTYGYSAQPGAKYLDCINYYNNEEIRIPMDPQLTALENAAKYFERYNKLKRTYEALSSLVEETHAELIHLESVSNALEIARDENDLAMIREELVECHYMKRHGQKKKRTQGKSRPLHYISSDGFHMYVGKNNFQNDELTFKLANGKDMWFHAKKMAGSHVIVRLETADELPDRTYEEAARLAAYYSKGRNAPRVEIDYTRRRNLKKPPHAKPGFVIYHTNYSMNIEPDITGIKEV